ncbi:hypothetical protein [Streptomyces sp. NPDC102437]|uniref:hypothetical protein n=1 Tax=Streptomyces sp. NPDC102437 TaxID=3366175 RepID=UPI00382E7D70
MAVAVVAGRDSTEPPGHHLEHQLSLLHRETESLVAGLREAEARRQRTHTRYLDDLGRALRAPPDGPGARTVRR